MTVSYTFICRPHLPQVPQGPQFFEWIFCYQLLDDDDDGDDDGDDDNDADDDDDDDDDVDVVDIRNRALATVSCAFCRPHLPKGLGP